MWHDGNGDGCSGRIAKCLPLPGYSHPDGAALTKNHQAVSVFVTEQAKIKAVAQTVREVHQTGQPVLVGTRTIEKSELIAKELDGINFVLLNGKQDEDEAALVAEAGIRGAVTIATNMAGRGTDIKLTEESRELGGLFVIVSEPDDSARVDRQLIGRSARQGDPGTSQMFVSAADDVVVRHAAWLARYICKLSNGKDEIDTDLSKEVATLQQQAERKSAEVRRQMFRQETWLDDALKTLAK